MLVNSIEILNNARRNKYAVPQFNINDLEWTKYILEECEDLKTPVILGVSEGAIKHMGGYKTTYNMVTGLISDLNISIPVVIHLDHGKSIESCKKAVDNGFTSVMIDASIHDIDENIRITREVVLYAHERNVSVEAEVGHVGGVEDTTSSEIAYAKVENCIRLVKETNINSLAAALGSVHGMYRGEAHLNFTRMEEINNQITIPLVLHGGTGIPDNQVVEAVKRGMSKININTELQVVWASDVRKYLNINKEEFDPRKIIGAGELAIKNVVREKVILFGSNDKAKKIEPLS